MKKHVIKLLIFIFSFALVGNIQAQEFRLVLSDENTKILLEVINNYSVNLIFDRSEKESVLVENWQSPLFENSIENYFHIDIFENIYFLDNLNLNVLQAENDGVIELTSYIHEYLGLDPNYVDFQFEKIVPNEDSRYIAIVFLIGEKPGSSFCIIDIENYWQTKNFSSSLLCPDKTLKYNQQTMDDYWDFTWVNNEDFSFKGSAVESEESYGLLGHEWAGNTKTKDFRYVGTYPPSPFTDLPEADEDYEEVLVAVNDGWLEGYPDGTIKLDQPINRAEFTKVVIKSLELEEQIIPENINTICPDVPATEWYSTVFYTAKQLGAIQGYPEKDKDKSQWLCKPAQTINKVEAIKVIMELAGWYKDLVIFDTYSNQYLDTQDALAWYWLYTGYAKSNGLIRTENNLLSPADPITRRDMIYMTNRIREIFEVEVGSGM